MCWCDCDGLVLMCLLRCCFIHALMADDCVDCGCADDCVGVLMVVL